jgi:hypothetical protein
MLIARVPFSRNANLLDPVKWVVSLFIAIYFATFPVVLSKTFFLPYGGPGRIAPPVTPGVSGPVSVAASPHTPPYPVAYPVA